MRRTGSGDYWFDATALIGPGRPERVSDKQRHALLGQFAQANGLQYRAEVPSRKKAWPSTVLTGRCRSVLSHGTGTAPYVEFGHHGMRVPRVPSMINGARRSYVAIWHGGELPDFFVHAARNRPAAEALDRAAEVTRKAYDAVDEVMSVIPSTEATGAGTTAAERRERREVAQEKVTTIDLPELGRARVELATEDLERVRPLLQGEALGLLAGLSTDFALELSGPWLHAYGCDGELPTLDAEVWAWNFAVASRMLDLLAAWDVGLVRYRDIRFYTSGPAERPSSLDGRRKRILG